MNAVLFLGAGFSKPFGLPIMREFFGAVSSNTDISEADKTFIRDLRQRAGAGARMLDSTHDNLEHVLSFAMMSDAQDAADSLQPPASTRLRQILQRVYRKMPLTAFTDLGPYLLSLLNKQKGYGWSDQLTVITTNYDLVAEFGLWTIGMAPRLPTEWEAHTKKNGYASLYSKEPTHPRLCKLHGSLNWLGHDANSKKLLVEDRISRVHGPMNEPREREWRLPVMAASDYYSENNCAAPLIVPPTLYKQQSGPEFEDVWITARQALRSAQRLAVIGYSFPPSDTYMKYFFACSLVDNYDLVSIDIIDPFAESIVSRLRSSDYGTHFKQLLNPIPHPWHQSKYRLVPSDE